LLTLVNIGCLTEGKCLSEAGIILFGANILEHCFEFTYIFLGANIIEHCFALIFVSVAFRIKPILITFNFSSI
jgi:hypothetical protein